MNTEMKDLEKIAPELSKLKNENPFRVPEGYFDDFAARLQSKIEAEQVDIPSKKSTIIRYLKPAIGLAAGFALIFSLAYWPLKSLTPNQVAKNNTIEMDINDMLFASAVEAIDVNSFYELLEKPSNSELLSDDDVTSYVKNNVSEYEIYSATHGN